MRYGTLHQDRERGRYLELTLSAGYPQMMSLNRETSVEAPVLVRRPSSDSPCLVALTQSRWMSVICSSLIDVRSYSSSCRPVRGSENVSNLPLPTPPPAGLICFDLASNLARHYRRRLWYSGRRNSGIEVSKYTSSRDSSTYVSCAQPGQRKWFLGAAQ